MLGSWPSTFYLEMIPGTSCRVPTDSGRAVQQAVEVEMPGAEGTRRTKQPRFLRTTLSWQRRPSKKLYMVPGS